MTEILTVTVPSAPARTSGTVAVITPPDPANAAKSWQRLVTGIDPAARPGAWQLQGPWLRPGTAYELPAGAVVVACDQYPDRWHITMMVAAQGGLETVKEWDRKSPMGKQVTDWIARRLPGRAASHRYRLLDELPNLWPGRCSACRRPVPAGTGRVVDIDGRNRVLHLPGRCPPPPQVIAPNRRGETCMLCADWVEPGNGIAMRMTQPDTVTGSWYRAAHQSEPGACPPGALPGPRNRAEGWCGDCGELVRQGEGFWAPWAQHSLRHTGGCPTPTLHGPTWQIRRHRHEAPFEAGQVRRVRIDLRRGGDPVPQDAPGRRVLAEHYIELVALVVETVARGRRQWARVCPATGSESAAELAADTAAALSARPDAGAYTASWSAEKIGDTAPWLAELTGRDPDMVYQRDFMQPRRDHRRSNSRGTRGVIFNWTLLPGRVYEALEPLSRRESRRMFLHATPEGDVAELTREEAEAWLTHAPVWADI